VTESRKAPILVVEEVSKHFGGVKAVDRVSMEVYSGEVLGIVGDNGAGKSTLIKMISGVYQPDGGKIYFGGKEINRSSPRDRREMGIETIYQDLALADNLDAGANIFLGREPVRSRRFNTVDRNYMRKEAEKTLGKLGFQLPSLKRHARDLSGGQRQGVAIGRAVHWNAKLLIMDEPTAALGVAGRRNVYQIAKDAKDKNVAVIYVTPNVREAFSIVERLFVLRKGRKIVERSAESSNVNDIVGFIVGSKNE
jgi:ABC-type sugar transport system ATPase subunit